MCDRVTIIKEGKIISTQKISDLRENAYKKVSFTAKDTLPAALNLSGVSNTEVKGNQMSFLYKWDCNKLLDAIGKFSLLNIDISEPSLEEIFMHYYEV